MIGALFASYNPPLRVVDGANFDGTNDFMVHASTAMASASKTGIASWWMRLNGGDGAQQCIFATGTAAQFFIQRAPANVYQISGKNSSNVAILNFTSTNTFLSGSGWKHILASWDLANSIASMYINDVAETVQVFTMTNDNINYANITPAFGAFSNGSSKCFADITEPYLAAGQYLDFSLVANRRKFISASGKPVHLGADGSLPTGIAPTFYQHLDDGETVANFATNRGAGGNFTITGTLTAASSSPSD